MTRASTKGGVTQKNVGKSKAERLAALKKSIAQSKARLGKLRILSKIRQNKPYTKEVLNIYKGMGFFKNSTTKKFIYKFNEMLFKQGFGNEAIRSALLNMAKIVIDVNKKNIGFYITYDKTLKPPQKAYLKKNMANAFYYYRSKLKTQIDRIAVKAMLEDAFGSSKTLKNFCILLSAVGARRLRGVLMLGGEQAGSSLWNNLAETKATRTKDIVQAAMRPLELQISYNYRY